MNTADSGNHWLDLEPDRPQERTRRHRREGQADHRFRPRALQPCGHQRGLHVLQRQAGALRAGQETKVASIEIRWPSGIQQVLKDVAADQFLEVDEPANNRTSDVVGLHWADEPSKGLLEPNEGLLVHFALGLFCLASCSAFSFAPAPARGLRRLCALSGSRLGRAKHALPGIAAIA